MSCDRVWVKFVGCVTTLLLMLENYVLFRDISDFFSWLGQCLMVDIIKINSSLSA